MIRIKIIEESKNEKNGLYKGRRTRENNSFLF